MSNNDITSHTDHHIVDITAQSGIHRATEAQVKDLINYQLNDQAGENCRSKIINSAGS